MECATGSVPERVFQASGNWHGGCNDTSTMRAESRSSSYASANRPVRQDHERGGQGIDLEALIVDLDDEAGDDAQSSRST